MNATVSKATTIEATKQPVRPGVVRNELPPNAPVSETTTIEGTPPPVQPSEQPNPFQDLVLARILRMANSLRHSGEIRHAIHLFSKVRRDYPDSLEAKQASEHLIEVAEYFEREGDVRQAESIYEELL